jgi:hypothetical protein
MRKSVSALSSKVEDLESQIQDLSSRLDVLEAIKPKKCGRVKEPDSYEIGNRLGLLGVSLALDVLTDLGAGKAGRGTSIYLDAMFGGSILLYE